MRSCVELSLLVSIVSMMMTGAFPVVGPITAEEETPSVADSRTKRSHRAGAHVGGVNRPRNPVSNTHKTQTCVTSLS